MGGEGTVWLTPRAAQTEGKVALGGQLLIPYAAKVTCLTRSGGVGWLQSKGELPPKGANLLGWLQ